MQDWTQATVCVCVFFLGFFYFFSPPKALTTYDGHCHAVADLIVEKRLRWQ